MILENIYRHEKSQDFIMADDLTDLQGARTAIKEQEGEQILTSPLQKHCQF